MKKSNQTILRFLDHSLANTQEFEIVSNVVSKISKCKSAVNQGANLADLLSDRKNIKTLEREFGEEFAVGMQILSKICLGEHEGLSFTINKDISEESKLNFFYKSVGGWKQFDTVICFHYEKGRDGESYRIINPTKQLHWRSLEIIPAGTIVTVFLRAKSAKYDESHVGLALKRYKAIFEAMQEVALENQNNYEEIIPDGALKEKRRSKVRKKRTRRKNEKNFSLTSGVGSMINANSTPVKSLRFVISKQDTFVHAGNAHLILSHIREYDGAVKMYVMRGEKDIVRMDADSIWSKEIRNGEEVLFEFFGNAGPEEAFLSELIKKTNKYTQMDKCL